MRKQKKRFIACILALTLAGGQLVPASAAGTDQMPAQEKTVGTVEETQENQETDLTDQGDMAESGENPDMDPAEDADAPDSVQDDTDSSQDDAGSTEEQDPEAGAGLFPRRPLRHGGGGYGPLRHGGGWTGLRCKGGSVRRPGRHLVRPRRRHRPGGAEAHLYRPLPGGDRVHHLSNTSEYIERRS